MNVSREDDQPRPGLRERKKAKTRAAIQDHALRLFREQGYEQTTVEQIADAAEVSPSTFFRYFPTKEEVVMYDAFDPIIVEVFRQQPRDLTPIQAMRRTIRQVFGNLPAEQIDQQRERGQLIFSVPELRMRMLDEFTKTMQMFSGVLAEWMGRPVNDFAVRTMMGALAGAMLGAVLPAVEDLDADFVELMDEGLAYLEAGMPL